MKHDIFISCANQDSEVSKRIKEILEKLGYDCFYNYTHDVESRQDLARKISQAILNSHFFSLLSFQMHI